MHLELNYELSNNIQPKVLEFLSKWAVKNLRFLHRAIHDTYNIGSKFQPQHMHITW
jgi:hypothetical protein